MSGVPYAVCGRDDLLWSFPLFLHECNGAEPVGCGYRLHRSVLWSLYTVSILFSLDTVQQEPDDTSETEASC